MYFLTITPQSLDSLKRIIFDSIQKSNNFPIDIVNKVDNFYNHAWVMVASVIGMVTLIVPFIINFLQSRWSKQENERMLDEMKRSIVVQKEEIKKFIEETVQEESKNVAINLQNTINASKGVSYHVQAISAYSIKDFNRAFQSYVTSLSFYVLSAEFENFESCVRDFYNSFSEKKQDFMNALEGFDFKPFRRLIEKIENLTDLKYYQTELMQLRALLNAYEPLPA